MRRLAELLGDLAEAPHTAARGRRLVDYFSGGADDLGWTLAWLTNALKPPRQTPAKLRKLAETRVDPELFRLSAAAIGDIGETVALIWPGAGDLSVATVAADDLTVPQMLDQLDTEARIAAVRLITGRKIPGVKPREVHKALGAVFNADPDLIAGAMIEEPPPYACLCAWLNGDGPAPNWAPPRPPSLPRLDKAPEQAFQAFDLPPGEPVALETGRAFGRDGGEVKLKADSDDGWGFYHEGRVVGPMTTPAISDPHEAHKAGQTLLILFGDAAATTDWAIWPPEARTVTCPVTFIETARTVNVTLGVMMGAEAAPLIKLPTPDAAKVSAFARKAVIEKFGPVRQVGPGLWAEVAYEAIAPAPRRKIGVTLQGARIERLIWDDGPATPDLSDIS